MEYIPTLVIEFVGILISFLQADTYMSQRFMFMKWDMYTLGLYAWN